jgi:uncharacterized Zn-finger protein
MGVEMIEIGSHKFMCMGALPPFDHPHVFLTIGDGHEAVCPYCSTHYKFSATLADGAAKPAAARYQEEAA